MTSKATYFIHSDYLGEGNIDSNTAPCSWALFCCSCGDIWARIVVNGGDGIWQVDSVPCESHSARCVADANRVPGSVLTGLSSRSIAGLNSWPMCIETLPREMLEREFLLRTKDYVH